MLVLFASSLEDATGSETFVWLLDPDEVGLDGGGGVAEDVGTDDCRVKLFFDKGVAITETRRRRAASMMGIWMPG